MGHVSEKTDTYAFGVVLCELLTGKPPADYGTGETLAGTMQQVLCNGGGLGDSNSGKEAEWAQRMRTQLPPLLDERGGRWPLATALGVAWCAQLCIQPFAARRCEAKDVLPRLDMLAGRKAVRRAGRDEEYDTETGELIKKKVSRGRKINPITAESTRTSQTILPGAPTIMEDAGVSTHTSCRPRTSSSTRA